MMGDAESEPPPLLTRRQDTRPVRKIQLIALDVILYSQFFIVFVGGKVLFDYRVNTTDVSPCSNYYQTEQQSGTTWGLALYLVIQLLYCTILAYALSKHGPLKYPSTFDRTLKWCKVTSASLLLALATIGALLLYWNLASLAPVAFYFTVFLFAMIAWGFNTEQMVAASHFLFQGFQIARVNTALIHLYTCALVVVCLVVVPHVVLCTTIWYRTAQFTPQNPDALRWEVIQDWVYMCYNADGQSVPCCSNVYTLGSHVGLYFIAAVLSSIWFTYNVVTSLTATTAHLLSSDGEQPYSWSTVNKTWIRVTCHNLGTILSSSTRFVVCWGALVAIPTWALISWLNASTTGLVAFLIVYVPTSGALAAMEITTSMCIKAFDQQTTREFFHHCTSGALPGVRAALTLFFNAPMNYFGVYMVPKVVVAAAPAIATSLTAYACYSLYNTFCLLDGRLRTTMIQENEFSLRADDPYMLGYPQITYSVMLAPAFVALFVSWVILQLVVDASFAGYLLERVGKHGEESGGQVVGSWTGKDEKGLDSLISSNGGQPSSYVEADVENSSEGKA